MAVRKIEYRVKTDGIEPAVKQFAGVQGDHKATELIFNIDTTLYESLTEQSLDGGKLIYRFDGYDGEGGLCRSDTRDLTKTVTYPLEEWLTRFGGIVKVVLVISLLKDDLTEMELFSFPALLQLKNLPEGTETDGESYESMSVLAQVAKDSANTAVSSAEVAVDAKEKTELARAALENGTVWVFDGGDAEGNVDADVKFVVDGEMSDNSENAVMNKIVKAYVDAISKDLEKTDKTVDSNKQKIDELKEQLSSRADYIVEQGIIDGWIYRKWASGMAEMWLYAGSNEIVAGDPSVIVCSRALPFSLKMDDGYYPVINVSGFHYQHAECYITLAIVTPHDGFSSGMMAQAMLKCTNVDNIKGHARFNFYVMGMWK